MNIELLAVISLNFLCLKSVTKFSTVYGIWFSSGYSLVEWGFTADGLSRIMLLIVVLVSTLVHQFSIDYMKSDPHSIRFMAYLLLFT